MPTLANAKLAHITLLASPHVTDTTNELLEECRAVGMLYARIPLCGCHRVACCAQSAACSLHIPGHTGPKYAHDTCPAAIELWSLCQLRNATGAHSHLPSEDWPHPPQRHLHLPCRAVHSCYPVQIIHLYRLTSALPPTDLVRLSHELAAAAEQAVPTATQGQPDEICGRPWVCLFRTAYIRSMPWPKNALDKKECIGQKKSAGASHSYRVPTETRTCA